MKDSNADRVARFYGYYDVINVMAFVQNKLSVVAASSLLDSKTVNHAAVDPGG